MKLKNLPWIPFAFFAIAIGIYPFIFYLFDIHNHDKGLLHSKPAALTGNMVWMIIFYIHITFGGIALLIGWTQFSKKLRDRYLKVHRTVGKIYVVSVLLSSCAGLYVAFFATGGIITTMGFGSLALLWHITVVKAYTSIRRLDITAHEKWMIRNYALTFAAVTFRIWTPFFIFLVFHGDVFASFRAASWLCWVPNIIVAELIIRKISAFSVRKAESVKLKA
jgi:uncharacterized membrane protein